MYLESNVQKYIAFSEDSIIDVLKKINDNKARIVFVVSDHAKLLGCLSDGDVRRWLTKTKTLDLFLPVSDIMNVEVKSLPLGAEKKTARLNIL